jgi:general secretion pathway protein G
MKSFSGAKGFTLIELMVVIAIIGILATLAMMGAAAYREKAKVAEAIADLDRIYKAIVLLENDTNEWPGHQTIGQVNNGGANEVWDLSAASAGIVATDGAFSDWDGPYMSAMPDDPWGNPYFLDTDYTIGGVDRIVLGSFGPNGVGPNIYDSDDVRKLLD